MSPSFLVDTSVINDILLNRARAKECVWALANLRRSGPGFVSAVTVQELVAFWGEDRIVEAAAVTGGFPVLPLDEGSALAAGRLFLLTRPKKSAGSVTKVWHRDSAIVGMAITHGIGSIVTTDGGMRQLATQAHLHVVP